MFGTKGGTLGGNPFRGKSFDEIDSMLVNKGFRRVGPNPAEGKGSYFHPESGRKYYLDAGGQYREGVELPHVDVHRMENGVNLEKVGKHRYPLGDQLVISPHEMQESLGQTPSFSVGQYSRYLMFAPMMAFSGDVPHDQRYGADHRFR